MTEPRRDTTTSAARSERPVLLLVAIGLLAVEGVLQWAAPRLSGDSRHLDEAPAIVEGLLESDGVRVLLAGNSLIGAAVDPPALTAALEQRLDGPVSVAMIRPDGTTPLEWDYLYRRLLPESGALPDLIVLGFGPGHLRDRPAELNTLRLARHHVALADVGDLLANDLTDLESRAQFALAYVWASFGLRDRISTRVLDLVIPNYRELAPSLLRAGAGNGAGDGGGGGATTLTYRHLDNLLASLRRRGVPVVAMPMPAPDPYSVDDGALRVLAAHGVAVLDLNPVPGLVPERFPDGDHLDAEGRALFTQALAPALAGTLAQLELER